MAFEPQPIFIPAKALDAVEPAEVTIIMRDPNTRRTLTFSGVHGMFEMGVEYSKPREYRDEGLLLLPLEVPETLNVIVSKLVRGEQGQYFTMEVEHWDSSPEAKEDSDATT